MTPQHIITVKGDQVDVECKNCKMGMTVSTKSSLGAVMVEEWPKLHKCSKAAKK